MPLSNICILAVETGNSVAMRNITLQWRIWTWIQNKANIMSPKYKLAVKLSYTTLREQTSLNKISLWGRYERWKGEGIKSCERRKRFQNFESVQDLLRFLQAIKVEDKMGKENDIKPMSHEYTLSYHFWTSIMAWHGQCEFLSNQQQIHVTVGRGCFLHELQFVNFSPHSHWTEEPWGHSG